MRKKSLILEFDSVDVYRYGEQYIFSFLAEEQKMIKSFKKQIRNAKKIILKNEVSKHEIQSQEETLFFYTSLLTIFNSIKKLINKEKKGTISNLEKTQLENLIEGLEQLPQMFN